jgi:dihydroxyacetone kinase
MDKLTTKDIISIVDVMSDVIIKNEVPFCELDSAAGDGDFGMSLAKGFRQLKAEWDDLDTTDIGSFIKSCGMIILENCGGASGPIWGSAFRGAAKAVGDATEIGLSELAEMMQAAVTAIQKTGERSFGRGAKVGDKTLIDALVPCADSLTESAANGEELLGAMRKAADAAVEGAEKTKLISAKMGRAANVGDRSLNYPDAGAYALGVIFTAIVDFLEK